MLRFVNLGLGDSEGGWGDGSFTVKVADIVRAVEYMRASSRTADLLAGHSFGGAAAIAAARGSYGIRAVVTIAAPFDPSRVERHYDALADRAVTGGSAQGLVGGRALTLTRQFVEDVRRAELGMHVRQLGLPLLVMHSPTDQTLGIRNAEQIFQAARHPRSFVAIEGADHLLLTRPHAARVAQVISGWVGPYLGAKAH